MFRLLLILGLGLGDSGSGAGMTAQAARQWEFQAILAHPEVNKLLKVPIEAIVRGEGKYHVIAGECYVVVDFATAGNSKSQVKVSEPYCH